MSKPKHAWNKSPTELYPHFRFALPLNFRQYKKAYIIDKFWRLILPKSWYATYANASEEPDVWWRNLMNSLPLYAFTLFLFACLQKAIMTHILLYDNFPSYSYFKLTQGLLYLLCAIVLWAVTLTYPISYMRDFERFSLLTKRYAYNYEKRYFLLPIGFLCLVYGVYSLSCTRFEIALTENIALDIFHRLLHACANLLWLRISVYYLLCLLSWSPYRFNLHYGHKKAIDSIIIGFLHSLIYIGVLTYLFDMGIKFFFVAGLAHFFAMIILFASDQSFKAPLFFLFIMDLFGAGKYLWFTQEKSSDRIFNMGVFKFASPEVAGKADLIAFGGIMAFSSLAIFWLVYNIKRMMSLQDEEEAYKVQYMYVRNPPAFKSPPRNENPELLEGLLGSFLRYSLAGKEYLIRSFIEEERLSQIPEYWQEIEKARERYQKDWDKLSAEEKATETLHGSEIERYEIDPEPSLDQEYLDWFAKQSPEEQENYMLGRKPLPARFAETDLKKEMAKAKEIEALEYQRLLALYRREENKTKI